MNNKEKDMTEEKMNLFYWDSTCDGSIWDKPERFFPSQETCYEDMLKAAINKSICDCGWHDVVEYKMPDEDGVVRKESYVKFSGEYSINKILITHSIEDYVYEIHSRKAACTRAQYDAVMSWATKSDGYDGAIGGMFSEFVWYPHGDAEGEKAVWDNHWWDSHIDKWNGIPPSADFCADEAKRTGLPLDAIVLRVAEEMADKCEKLNQETKDHIAAHRTRKFRVGLSTVVNTSIEVDASSETEAVNKAKQIVLDSIKAEGSAYELSTMWEFFSDMKAVELNFENCEEVK